MPQEPPLTGLDEAIALFLRNKRALDDGTQAGYERVLRRFKAIAPDWPPTNEGIIDFVIDCQLTLKKATVHGYWSVVHNFISFLVQRRLIPDNPLDGISPPEKPDALPRAPNVEHVEKLVHYLESQVEQILSQKRADKWGWRKIRDLALMSLIIDTGPRISEALGITLEDIDLTYQSIYIRNPKGPKTRFVFFGKKTAGDLNLWLSYRRRLPILEEKRYLFPTFWGGFRQMTPVSVRHNLIRVCAGLEIFPSITPHRLRHFYVSFALDTGNPEYVRQQVGHSSLEITSRYARSHDPRRREDHLKSSPRDRLF